MKPSTRMVQLVGLEAGGAGSRSICAEVVVVLALLPLVDVLEAAEAAAAAGPNLLASPPPVPAVFLGAEAEDDDTTGGAIFPFNAFFNASSLSTPPVAAGVFAGKDGAGAGPGAGAAFFGDAGAGAGAGAGLCVDLNRATGL